MTTKRALWPHAAVYFGTWQQAGHYHFLPGMRRVPYTHAEGWSTTPWALAIDRAPTFPHPRGRAYGLQGDATLRHKGGWTALVVADYTVDRRPNVHATFAFLGDLTFDQALEAAREHFPEVVARVGEIREVPGGE